MKLWTDSLILCMLCRWLTVPISHKPKSIYFQLSLFFSCTERAWTSLISILLQLATDASLLSADPNCTWWAKLMALCCLTFLQLWGRTCPTAPSQTPAKHTHVHTDIHTHTHQTLCAPQYLKTEGGSGRWEWGEHWWPQISCCNCESLPVPVIFQACLVQWGEFVCFGVKAI